MLSVAGCSSINTVTEQPVESSIGIVEEYLLGVGDELDVNVWRNPDLSVSVTVRPDGKVSVPLIGDLQVDGSTTEALAASIQSQLGSFIRNPQVTVIVTNPTSAEYIHRIRITGAVGRQQSLPFRKGMTVLDAIFGCRRLKPIC